MKHEYFCPKEKITQKDAEFAYIFFTNGEYLQIRKNEIVKIDVNLYDRLIFKNRTFSPVGESGSIKLRIQSGKAKGESRYLDDKEAYEKNRKEYIENRCVNEKDISHVYIFDENNWHRPIYGNIKADIEGEYLFLRFVPNELYGPWASDRHTVNIMPLDKNSIFKIHLDFENCEGFDVYGEEIIDINIDFENELEWNSSAYARVVRGGYIRLKLDENFYNRDIHSAIHWEKPHARIKLKDLEKRLCGKGIDDIDICHLYVTYNVPASGEYYEEAISVNELHDKLDESVDESDDYYEPPFISGYAERQDDKSILIVFGKTKN